MTGSRKVFLLCETFKIEIEVIENLLSVIKEWYCLTSEKLTDIQSQLETKDAHEYAWDELDDKYRISNKVRRIMYANVAVSLFAIAEYFLFLLCVNFGIIQVKIRRSGKTEIKNSGGKIIERPNWGVFKNQIERNTKIKFVNIPCFDTVNRVRLLNNCFKHSNGTINKDFVKNFGGAEGDDIEYESEDWKKLILDCETLLFQLADKTKNYRA